MKRFLPITLTLLFMTPTLADDMVEFCVADLGEAKRAHCTCAADFYKSKLSADEYGFMVAMAGANRDGEGQLADVMRIMSQYNMTEAKTEALAGRMEALDGEARARCN